MTRNQPTIPEILDPFFAAQKVGAQPELITRFDAVERKLRTCIEQEANRILDDDTLALVEREREAHPEDAAARMMNGEDLVYLLSIFVTPRWLPEDLAQRAIHCVLTEQLTRFVIRRNLIDEHEHACILLEIGASVNRGKADWQRQRALRAQPAPDR
jgi:hypothetical protein